MKRQILKICLLSSVLFSCTVTNDTVVQEVSNYELKPLALPAIVQVKQSLNLAAEESAEAIVSILKNNNISVVNHDPNNNSFESDWIAHTDYACNGYRLNNAPLSCRTKLFFKISSINQNASSVNIMNKEVCNINEDVFIRCPNSKAEKMMFAVVDELKEL